jgi:hypothetical protein
MGEHRSDGGHPGRRQVHPADAAHTRPAAPAGDAGPAGHHRAAGAGGPDRAGSSPVLREAELEVLLAAVLLRDGIDAEAEQRAVAAFRAARDAGAYRARTRRRDDWRSREWRLPGRSLKATLSVLLASLTLGGVAVAAIGSVSSPDDSGERGRPPASAPATGPSADGPADGTAGSSADPGHPGTARDTEAHCRAYEQAGGRGRALDATAWQRLVEAAGGETKVTAYCAEQLTRAEESSGGTAGPGKGQGTPGSGNAGAPGNTGNGPGAEGRGTGSQEGGSGAGESGTGTGGSGTGAGAGGTGAGESGSGAARNGEEGAADSGSSGTQGRRGRPDGPRS